MIISSESKDGGESEAKSSKIVKSRIKARRSNESERNDRKSKQNIEIKQKAIEST